MINYTLASVMCTLSGLGIITVAMCALSCVVDHQPIPKALIIVGSICLALFLITGIGLITSSGEYLPPKYYEITEVGKVDDPKQVAVVEGDVLDITYNHNVVLYNPELYYLEVKQFKGCTRCLVSKLDRIGYRVVPKSLIEVQ